MMPVRLVFVRHGESEGNVAKRLSRRGDTSAFTPEFLDRHSYQFRLTDVGIKQAEAAGVWIKANINGGKFDRQYVSEYVRAIETAARLSLPDALWRKDLDIRERDYGLMDLLSPEDTKRLYSEELKLFRRDSLLMPTPGGGESMATVGLRSKAFFDTLHRECSRNSVIVVSHGEFIWSCRIRLERITIGRYHELDSSKNPHDRIHNCQIIEYTRVDPKTGEEASCYNWMRSVCPSGLLLSRNEWVPIVRKKFTNEDLLAEVESYPRYIS